MRIRTTQVAPQCVFLTATPTEINAGDPVVLAWKTLNATSITINNGVGPVTPVAEGSVVVRPTANTTYTATVANASGSVTCSAPVRITTVQTGPSCVRLIASDQNIKSGDEVTLSWETSKATSISINNGIGPVTPVAAGSIVVRPTSDTTYIATVPGAPENSNCRVTVEIESTGCTSNCGGGGGGGGGRSKPRVILDSLKVPGEEPLAFVYLSQTPYTGLDLGTWGTALYWLVLIAWSAAMGYLVLFNAVPFALARAKRFGGNVKDALNAAPAHAPSHAAPAHAVMSHAPVAHAPAPRAAHAPAAPARPSAYSANEGFKSFATSEALSIDDIVKGLARMPEDMPVFQKSEAPLNVEPIHPSPVQYAAPAPEKAKAAMMPISDNVQEFIKALLDGDRDTVFGTVRKISREGGDTEAFLTHTVCALDEAYRACIDGTTCHPDIAELTKGCHPSFLERLVSALTTAVDGSYSAGITGVKLGLTRALGVVQG